MLRLCLVRDMTWMATCSFELVLFDLLVAKQTPKYKVDHAGEPKFRLPHL